MTLKHTDTTVRLYLNLAHFECLTIVPHLDNTGPRTALAILFRHYPEIRNSSLAKHNTTQYTINTCRRDINFTYFKTLKHNKKVGTISTIYH